MENLKFLGIGGAVNIEMGANCAYLKKNKKLILVDCGEESSLKLEKAKAFENISEVDILLTHMHADHVSGLGVLIWHCNYLYNITPKIYVKTETFKKSVETYLSVVGVSKNKYSIIKEDKFVFDDLNVVMMPTRHEPTLECFGIMFSDNEGKYYYSGDTCDIEYIASLTKDKSIKKIYCEVNVESFNVHIAYRDLLPLDKSKLVLMHFGSKELYEVSIKDGFEVSKVC